MEWSIRHGAIRRPDILAGNSFNACRGFGGTACRGARGRVASLTLQEESGKSNGKVSCIPPQFYSLWRERSLAVDVLRETEESPPPERLLQQIWQHQRVRRGELQTEDGLPLKVLHPGFWNREAGPDFKGTVIQFGTDQPISGDVEIDLRPAGWRGHRHEGNPDYRNVILHVVWDGASNQCALPTLRLKSRLDAPLKELRLWLGTEPGWSDELTGHCASPLRGISGSALTVLLEQAALVRLHGKGQAMAARARQAGWEQALWEALFGGLGFKRNVWPMRRLAELLPELLDPQPAMRSDTARIQALLLGVSGLLPANPGRGDVIHRYVRQMWDFWWRESGRMAEVILPQSLWRFGGVRPANQPHRRIALAAHWIAQGNLATTLEQWLATTPIPDSRLVSSLTDILQDGIEDRFWMHHLTFRSAPLPRPQPMLGSRRATDLAMNVILPWLRVRANSGGNDSLRQVAEQRYFAWPRAQDNVTLRLARERLLGGKGETALSTAARQQGLLQIVRDFCERSNAVCDNCEFPQLVLDLNAHRPI
jgi:hypothetical protein